jgi:hypothetical protein
MAGAITAGVIVGGAALAGAYMSSEAAKAAAKAQVGASQDASAVSYKISQEQLAAQKEALDKQIAAAGATVDKQLLAQRDALDQQMAFQTARYEQARADFAPYRDTGVAATNQLNTLLGIGGNTGAANYGKYATAEFTPAMFKEGVDPGYAFRLSEGLKGIDRQAAARGGLISGNALKAASGYAGEQASQEYTNAFNRYQTTRGNTLSPFQNLSAQGLNAAAMTGSAGAAYGNAGGQAISNAGQGISGAFGTAGAAANAAYGAFGQGTTGVLGAYGTNASNNLIGAGNATASGYVGGANAVNSGVSGLTNAYYQNKMLDMFQNSPRGLINQYGANNVYGSGFNNYQPNGGSLLGTSDY